MQFLASRVRLFMNQVLHKMCHCTRVGSIKEIIFKWITFHVLMKLTDKQNKRHHIYLKMEIFSSNKFLAYMWRLKNLSNLISSNYNPLMKLTDSLYIFCIIYKYKQFFEIYKHSVFVENQ